MSLDRLKRKLQAERIGILIDKLKPGLDAAGRFIELHRYYVELLYLSSYHLAVPVNTALQQMQQHDH